MGIPCANFPMLCSVEIFNSFINGANSDNTYLGKIEIPVSFDENQRFFGTHIKEIISFFKSLKKKI